MEKKVAQKSPMVMDMEPGVYAWCACGHSSKQPFCDGSHAGSDMSPVIEKIEEPTKVAWCGCKCSSNGTRCDGTHASL